MLLATRWSHGTGKRQLAAVPIACETTSLTQTYHT